MHRSSLWRKPLAPQTADGAKIKCQSQGKQPALFVVALLSSPDPAVSARQADVAEVFADQPLVLAHLSGLLADVAGAQPIAHCCILNAAAASHASAAATSLHE